MSMSLVELIPLSLGVQICSDIDVFEPIILRNSPIPATVTKDFYTTINNQTEISIRVNRY